MMTTPSGALSSFSATALAELVRTGMIAPEEGLQRANNQETFKQLAGITGRSGASMM